LAFWISASFACWQSVRFSGFFQTANRAPFQIAGELHVSLSARFVSDLAAHLVKRVGR
jgi:hypothetical protein